jgi:hypothetical protein
MVPETLEPPKTCPEPVAVSVKHRLIKVKDSEEFCAVMGLLVPFL